MDEKTAWSRGHYVRAILAFVLVLAPLVGWYFWYRSTGAALERELAWARAQGYPTDWDELDAWYKEPPKGENAADHYLRAFALLDNPLLPPGLVDAVPIAGAATMPPPTEPIPETQKNAALEYIAACVDALEALEQGSKYAHARYPLAPVQGMRPYPEPAQGTYKAVLLMSLVSVLRADHNEPAEATEGLLTALRVASSAAEGPYLALQMSRSGCNSAIVDALRQVLHRTRLDEEQLKALGEALAQAEAHDTLHVGLAGEMAFEASWLRAMQAQKVPVSVARRRNLFAANVHLIGPFGVDRLDEAYMRSSMRECIRIARLPVEQRLAAAQAHGMKLEDPPWYAVRSNLLLAAPNLAAEMTVEHSAELRCAVAAVAVERYRLAHGELPPSLEALVPEYLPAVPVDPYDRQPLRYGIREQGYDIYSVGRNLVDDQGMSEEDASSESTRANAVDEVFRVEPQP